MIVSPDTNAPNPKWTIEMGSNVIPLPTRATSYYTIRVSGRAWAVDLVTPIEGQRPLRTRLARFGTRIEAIAHGRDAAARTHRPFKIKGVTI